MEGKKTNQTHQRRKIVAFIIFPFIIVIGAAAIFFYLQYKRFIESDNWRSGSRGQAGKV